MKQKPQRRAKEVPQQRRAAAAAIVFKTNVICEDATGKTIFLEAGKPSPFFDLCDVPARLQAHVGEPQDTIAQDNEIQMVVKPERLQQEAEELEELNSGAHLDPEVREALAERGEEYLASVRARNAALEEAAAHQDIDHDQLSAEHEAESVAIYEG
jgi:hypothetical protein